MSKRIFLIGFMGSGKSSFGKRLAKKMAYSFLDSDLEIERLENRTIEEIFQTEGEAYFRQVETDWLAKEIEENTIIALGGGTPCHNDNMERINSLGVSVYLELEPKALMNRLVNAKTIRPLIMPYVNDPDALLSYIAELLHKRQEFYEKAELTFNASGITAQRLAELADLLQEKGKG